MTDLNRKLATIVALDVAGFSARAEADEAKTIAQVTLLRPVIEGIAKAHGGRVFNTAGDGFMLEFASSFNAVNAALELADECRPRVRVGVHVGEVMEQANGDLLGHGVNVAARLMAKAEPGSALISADVCRLIRGPMAERFASRGTVQLDKMAEMIEIFAPTSPTHTHPHAAAKPQSVPPVAGTLNWKRPPAKVAAAIGAAAVVLIALVVWWTRAPTSGGQGADEASIAVLPFADMSAAQDQQYFSDGISEELLNVLAQVQNLRVAGRTSSFAFKGQNKDLREIGEILNVGYIVEGSIRKDGNKVRITAQLVQAKDGYHKWSNTYDRDLTDIFTVQDEIAKEIVTEMSAAVPALAAASTTLKPTERADNISAYDKFLLAREKMTMDGGRKAYEDAEKLLDEAIAADPHYAPALAWRSYAAQMLSDAPGSVGTTPMEKALPVVKAFADRALAEDPGSAEGLFAMGGYHGLLFDLGDAKQLAQTIASLRKAIAIRPNFSQAENDLAYFLTRNGETEASTKMIEGVLQRDPGLRDANVIYIDYLKRMGRLDEADAALARWEKVSPNQPSIKPARISVVQARGNLAAAWRATEELTQAGVVDNSLERTRFSIAATLGNSEWLLAADIPGRQKAIGALLKGERKRALELLATDPVAPVPQTALQAFIPIHYDAGDIKGVVSFYDDRLGSPQAAADARMVCGCSMVSLLLALREAGHKDYKGVMALWKASLAAQKAEYRRGPAYMREVADVAALEGDMASAKAGYAAAMDAGWRSAMFIDESHFRYLPNAAGFAALRERMRTLINKERAALNMPPL
jgi:TolB-like protein/class 3 adenylate cyclase/Tfp pilus assembly protein PilF